MRKSNVKTPFSQRGISGWGMLGVACLAAYAGFSIFKLVPLFMDDLQVENVMEGLQEENKVADQSSKELRRTVQKRLDMNNITEIGLDALEIKRTKDGGKRLVFHYERRVNFFENVDFSVTFNHDVEL